MPEKLLKLFRDTEPTRGLMTHAESIRNGGKPGTIKTAHLCKAEEKSGEEMCDSREEGCLRLHVVLTLLLVELTLFLGRGVLVLLVLRHQVVHVALRLRELHLVHPLARVPVQERLAAEHPSELLGHTLEHLLDRGRVADEAHGHPQPLRGNVANTALHVVRDPLDEGPC